MNWKKLLNDEMESTYKSAERLMALVEDSQLDWKPATGANWMTTGQLLMHISNACGAPCKGFITGDWGLPEGVDLSKLPPEEMLPPAEKMPTVGSVAEAKQLLAADKQTALDMVAQSSEEDLANTFTTAPWDPTEVILGHRLLQMVFHLSQHRSQLFYYLKLQGKPVNTSHLW
ncbi:MAG: DinB family protein [Candidatus Omnitrophota bacterium]|jgi:uncharacterized damage-inducible protein DinB|nr:MAG: DinB family protein [Candidatus Omnitrophota bacterium]